MCVQNRAVLGEKQQLLPLGGSHPVTSRPQYETFFLLCHLSSKDHKALGNLTTFSLGVSFPLASLNFVWATDMEAP